MTESYLIAIIGAIAGLLGVFIGSILDVWRENRKAIAAQKKEVRAKLIGDRMQTSEIMEYINRNRRRSFLKFRKVKIPDLSRANLFQVDLRFQDLQNIKFFRADFREADLGGADLSESDLSYADFSNANLAYVNLSNSSLRNANLSNANLVYAKLNGADLSFANLNGANLSEAELKNAKFISANLANTDLSITKMEKADFRGAKLDNALLYGTNANNACFTEWDDDMLEKLGGDSELTASLKGAILDKGNFIGAKIAKAQLNEVKSMKDAKFSLDEKTSLQKSSNKENNAS